jgi:hypothetical protein
LGGLDGQLSGIDGDTIVFIKQEYYNDYNTIGEAWQDYTNLYGTVYSPETVGEYFDESYTVPGGYSYTCANTYASTNYIKTLASTGTVGMQANDPIWFTGEVFGGIDANGSNGLTQIYYVTDVVHTTCTNTTSPDLITCADATYLNTNDVVWFSGTTFGGVNRFTASNAIQQYYVTKISSTSFKISLTEGGDFVALSTASGTMTVNTGYFAVRDTTTPLVAGNFIVGKSYTIVSIGTTDFTAIGASSNTVGVSFVATGTGTGTGTAWLNVTLTTATGDMAVNFGNTRMAVFTISVDPTTSLVLLTPTQLTAETQYVQINRGSQFGGQQLYYPTSPAPGYTVVAWTDVPASNTTETTFDGASMAFNEPVDMYDPTNRDDKYLVFPKANILV